MMCKLFSVSRSGYYDWLNHNPSNRELENIKIDREIFLIFNDNKSRYGSPRIAKELDKKGISCSNKKVAKRMKILNLQAVAKRKFKVTTDSEHSKPVFDNILNRDFNTTNINQKWAGDITYSAPGTQRKQGCLNESRIYLKYLEHAQGLIVH